MEALLGARLPVSAVISNRPEAKGLATAAARGIPTAVVDHRLYAGRESFDAALAACVDAFEPRLLVLAGFMRVLTPGFVQRYAGRLLNIHPSLLPSFPGLDTHARAIAAGVKVHGCTVHFVTEALDQGPIVAQGALSVRADETAESLAARVLRLEHQVYPRAVRWFLEGRLTVQGNAVRVKGGDAQLVFAAD
jgi:phosphoribosylglycinamide formyltransferase 1